MTRTWTVRSVTDAARARIATARLATAHGVSSTDRARLVSVLSAQLRQCLTKGGAWLLTARAVTARPGGCRFLVEVTSANRRPGEYRQPWRLTVACSEEVRLPDSEHVAGDPTTLAEALFGADEDAALLLEKLDEKEALVAFHREELHQTNQGVLALHAELDAAGRAQRELFAAEQQARKEAENARGRLTLLADASAALTASLNPDAIVRLLPSLLVPRYARSADVWLFDGEGEVAGGGPRPAAAVVAARRGRPQYAADHPGELPGVDDHPPSALDPTRPLLCVPLVTRGAPLGVLTLSPPDDERWDADDVFMLIELARRAGVALENARRFEHNRDIAETLQRALLTELPTTPGLRLAARYLPATRGLNIGGDWYDAFRQPDGSLITVIGDVTGHGLHAAVMMSQLRTALRAYAVDGKTPGQLLTHLHLFLHHLQPDLYATAVIARFHPHEPTLTWAAAGHPPPVLRSPDGGVRILDAKPGAMLGIPLHQEIADHTEPLPPGSTLALYTDGLVERRALGIDPGIEQLATALGGLPSTTLDGDLQESADQLLAPLLDEEHEDDVCLLLCHVHSAAGRVTAHLN
ncbi:MULTISPECIES: PP2C family protein-serine/threonine phosphatase [Streptomyces]|uniref:SpoIIE family protein phosphatase n=1 Tax=Streptomyces caniscabiei TaxID=2746961 RepID=A0ABU4MTB2_9ACTN|nr:MULTISPECIES: GAF domain-containing SpoIIE family protein phosphatase [Streptomyces]MBE4737437.1 SpoIIE family protein phosphatase [Streptomyces caniscabiei]MBE4756197.1 SpoIIE family protein phosphatase [Streptomyces caniscabiei]MBE4787268.1 SpoIIE family protein phosphatase [Streptomyces caniscabiei]MBE4795327.1 SpoIIE family protein phosphatase [Streptomyces caniscabiei]MDX2945258.1 SpoIIE family protein phosphatase [Streptomyces caniscabiei]